MLVPKLRFKEFKNEWKTYNLKEVLEIKNGLNKEKESFGIGTPIINYMDVNKHTILTADKIKGLVKLSKKEIDNFKVNKGDIFFTRTSETSDEIGLSSSLIEDIEDCVFSGFILKATPIKNVFNNLFGGYYFRTYKVRKEIIKHSSITTRALTSGSLLYGMNINIPDIDEQEKIGTTLYLLDKKIEIQQRRIEVLKIYKKGLMQKLINFNNCEEKSVSEFGTIITGTTPSKLIDSYWNNGTIVWITPSDITESKDIYNSHDMLTQDGLKAGRFVPAGSILITCIASIGKNAILKIDGSCNQQINAIIPNKNFNADYLYYLFEKKKDYLQSTAGTSATSIINKSSFEKLIFKVPHLEEQNKIAKILNCLELKIENEKLKFEKLTFLKKSLLQQMFI